MRMDEHTVGTELTVGGVVIGVAMPSYVMAGLSMYVCMHVGMR